MAAFLAVVGVIAIGIAVVIGARNLFYFYTYLIKAGWTAEDPFDRWFYRTVIVVFLITRAYWEYLGRP